MIIVVSPEAAPGDIDHIVARIEESGRQAHLSIGTERTIIGVIGADSPELLAYRGPGPASTPLQLTLRSRPFQ